MAYCAHPAGCGLVTDAMAAMGLDDDDDVVTLGSASVLLGKDGDRAIVADGTGATLSSYSRGGAALCDTASRDGIGEAQKLQCNKPCRLRRLRAERVRTMPVGASNNDETGQSAHRMCYSVRSGTHAMHPLYDMLGKDGRQLVVPAEKKEKKKKKTGPKFMRRWVHTRCAMFISANELYSRLVYGCDEDGRWDMQSDEEDDDEDNHDDNINEDNEKDHVNGYEDSCDDLTASLRMEQASFTRCEDVFVLLMDRVRTESSDSKVANANDILVCIKLVIELVEPSNAMCCHSHVPRLN